MLFRSALAPLSVVQVALSTGVVMLAVLGQRCFGCEVGTRQWVGVLMTATGLTALVLTLPRAAEHSGYGTPALIAFHIPAMNSSRLPAPDTMLCKVRVSSTSAAKLRVLLTLTTAALRQPTPDRPLRHTHLTRSLPDRRPGPDRFDQLISSLEERVGCLPAYLHRAARAAR